MPHFHHQKLPAFSTLLSGNSPPDAVGFQSDQLQIWFNNTTEHWVDDRLHVHAESDECFIVLRGAITVDVEGKRFTIGAGEFCCFPRGIFHAVIGVEPPVESLMIRAPSVLDKMYRPMAISSEQDET